MKIKVWAISAIALVGSHGVWGQRALDTLYANESKNVALFFPSPIRQAVTGHENFVFSYDREEAGYFGLLQGVDGAESNLLVITTDGSIYAYVLKYAEELSQLNYFIREEGRIGNERPIQKANVPKDSLIIDGPHYDWACKVLLDRKPRIMVTKRKKGIRLRLEDMVYDGNEVYLVFGIRNRSGVDFELDYLDVFRINGSKKRRASYQETRIQVIHSHGEPSRVMTGGAIRFVFVVPKFVLGDREHLKLELGELHGSRKVMLIK